MCFLFYLQWWQKSTFQFCCVQGSRHFPSSSSSLFHSPQIMARFQPHRPAEEGQQSRSYLLALFQRLPQNEAAGPLSQNAPPQCSPRWAARGSSRRGWTPGTSTEAPCVDSLRGSLFHPWESWSGERECGEDVFIWILANLLVSQVFSF